MSNTIEISMPKEYRPFFEVVGSFWNENKNTLIIPEETIENQLNVFEDKAKDGAIFSLLGFAFKCSIPLTIKASGEGASKLLYKLGRDSALLFPTKWIDSSGGKVSLQTFASESFGDGDTFAPCKEIDFVFEGWTENNQKVLSNVVIAAWENASPVDLRLLNGVRILEPLLKASKIHPDVLTMRDGFGSNWAQWGLFFEEHSRFFWGRMLKGMEKSGVDLMRPNRSGNNLWFSGLMNSDRKETLNFFMGLGLKMGFHKETLNKKGQVFWEMAKANQDVFPFFLEKSGFEAWRSQWEKRMLTESVSSIIQKKKTKTL
jgi:hypothetical protein